MAAGASWNIANDIPLDIRRGGIATVSWNYGTLSTQSQSFCIGGTPPTTSMVQQELLNVTTTYHDFDWFILQLVKDESSYLQFTKSQPTYGPPGGYGLMQLDPPNGQQEIWDWTSNIAQGKMVANSKGDTATAWLNRQIDQQRTWNDNHANGPVIPAPDDVAANYAYFHPGRCAFSSKESEWSSTVHPIRDAIWIKLYNGSTVYYMFLSLPANNGTPFWGFDNSDHIPGQGYDYVAKICLLTP